MMLNDQEVLEDAARILSERGWCQGKLIDSEGRVCAQGAIMLALGFVEGTEDRVVDEVYEVPEALDIGAFLKGGEYLSPLSHSNLQIKHVRKSLKTLVPGYKLHGFFSMSMISARLNQIQNKMAAAIGNEGFVAHIPQWNDDPGRSAEDVILALKTAAHDA